MKVGFEFILDNLNDYKILASILNQSFLVKNPLRWRIDCASMIEGNISEGVFSSSELYKALQEEVIIDTIRICGFSEDMDELLMPLIKTYADFVNSSCLILIRCVDSYYFNVYVKNELIDELEPMIRMNKLKEFRIVTETTDYCTCLLAF